MRTIKFRGKRIDNGEWVYGDLIHGQGPKYGRCYILPHTHIYPKGCHDLDGWNVHPETVGQFTGLTDKDGREIYEGDLVCHQSRNGNKPHSIIYQSGAFCGNYGLTYSLFQENMEQYCEITVIGNIHDNPELI